MTIHGCYDRLADRGNCGGPGGDEVGVVGLGEGEVFHFFDVCAGWCRVNFFIFRFFVSRKSVPANAFSLPVSTIAPVLLSSSSFLKASFRSSNRADERAFRARGRLSVTGEMLVSVSVRKLYESEEKVDVLRPTPGFGESTKIFSY